MKEIFQFSFWIDIIFKLSESFKFKLYNFIYIISALSVLFIWQGREVSFTKGCLLELFLFVFTGLQRLILNFLSIYTR